MDDTETQPTASEQHQFAPDNPPVSPVGVQGEPYSGAAFSGEEQPSPRHHRMVPYGALAEERARRKELQRELQGAIETQQRLQGRLDLLHELAQQQGAVAEAGAAEEAVPKSDGDAPPHDGSPQEPPAHDVEAQAQFRTQLMHSVRDAMRDRPDFLAAYQHARQARVGELCALGYTPQEALAITFENEAEIIENAFARGQNPALVIYGYAQRRGYRGASPGGPDRGVTGQAPRSVATMSEAEKVALAARGQAASKSLSNAGGGSTGTLTLEALAGMSDDEFAEATKGDRWQKLLMG